MARPAFALLRHVERRQSNQTVTERSQSTMTLTRTEYQVMVTRLIILWVTVWTREEEYA